MSVGYVGSAGNQNGAGAQVSPYATPTPVYSVRTTGPSLAASISASPTPHATLSTTGTLAAPAASTVTSTGLMKAPDSGCDDPYGFQSEGSSSSLIQMSGTGQGKHTASKVFWATIATYGTFLAGVAAILTMPALGRYRGRAAQFTSTSKDHANYIKEEKQKRFDDEYTAFKRSASSTARGYDDDFNAEPSKTGYDRQSKIASTPISADTLMDHYVSVHKNSIEHNGWWEKLPVSAEHDGAEVDAKDAMRAILVGFHKKGAMPTGAAKNTPVAEEHGQIRLAFKDAGQAAGLPEEFSSIPERVVMVDPLKGRTVLHVFKASLPADVTKRNALLDQINVGEKERIKLKDALLEKKRIASNNDPFTAHSFEDQYERIQGTPGVDSNIAAKKAGQVYQRLKEYFDGVKKAWENAREGGNRTGLMLLSSTMLNATLAATAASVALCWTSAPAKPQQHQGENTNGVATQ